MAMTAAPTSSVQVPQSTPARPSGQAGQSTASSARAAVAAAASSAQNSRTCGAAGRVEGVSGGAEAAHAAPTKPAARDASGWPFVAAGRAPVRCLVALLGGSGQVDPPRATPGTLPLPGAQQSRIPPC
jgi:type IV secretory pathway TrbL component